MTSESSTPSQPSFAGLVGRALGMLAALSLLTGVAYPVLVTALAQTAFHDQANGSLVRSSDRIVGSRLIGQAFDSPRYFWGRLSATTPTPYNGGASGGSNLGPTSDELARAARARIDALRAADPGNDVNVPVDLVTASASGLDPHITPAAALYQVGRVARARHLDEARVRDLVESHIDGRALGVLGEARVNVLLLNLALDRLGPERPVDGPK